MKRFSLVLALAFVLAVGGMALAYDPRGEALPTNAQPTTTYELNGEGVWMTTTNAQSFNSGGASGHCNKECWDFTIENHVSVAQWIDWEINGTRKDWRVLKPGTYGSDSVTARIKSNNDVQISFWAEDPAYQNPDAESPPIPKWFGYSVGEDSGNNINNVVQWVRGSDYTPEDPLVFTIRFEDGLADGLAYRIWEKIEVTNQHRSSDYHGTGGLLICVTNLKYWVDPETGTFNNLTEPPQA